jgi:hypothetical protein
MVSDQGEQTPALTDATTEPQHVDPDRRREAVAAEIQKVIGRAEAQARGEQGRADAWSRLYFVVGLPAAILAAVAGATALASAAGRVVAGIIALIASGLTAAATFLDSDTRRRSHENLAAGWRVLANEAHACLVVDLQDENWLQRSARREIQDLLDRERKLLQGRAPDAEAEAERRAQVEAVRAQAETARAEAEAERARAAEQRARAETARAEFESARGRALAAAVTADAPTAEDNPSVVESRSNLPRRLNWLPWKQRSEPAGLERL